MTNKKKVLKDEPCTALNLHHHVWNSVWSFFGYFAFICIIGTISFCCHRISMKKTKMTPYTFATMSMSCHPQAFFSIKSHDSQRIFKLGTKISVIAPIVQLILSQKTEPPQKAFTPKIRVEERRIVTITTKTKKSLATKCQAIQNGSDLESNISLGRQLLTFITNVNQTNLTLGNDHMKKTLIDNPRLIRLFERTRKRLTNMKLTYVDKLETIHSALRETCRYSRINSESTFTKQDRHFFSQEIEVLILILTSQFELNDSLVNQMSHKFDLFWSGAGLSYPCGKLKQKYFDLLKLDMALELADLDRDLGEQDSYFIFAAKAKSLVPQYFYDKVFKMFQIMDEAILLLQKESTPATKYAIISRANNQVNDIRSETLIDKFNFTFPDKGPYAELFIPSLVKKKLSQIENLLI